MKQWVSACILVFSSLFVTLEAFAAAEAVRGFVTIHRGRDAGTRDLYVDYVPPKDSQPTVILLNGLTYSTRQWDNFVTSLVEQGVGVLRYDFYGQGQTLLRYAPILGSISYEEQIDDLKSLLDTLDIKGPYNIAGLSYGGGIAAGFAVAYPSLVKNLILMAPFTRPLEGQDVWIRAQIWATRQMF
ncbi:MAG: alpha/beta fold hydrolase, partial [Bdellovibrio sp.]